MISTSNPIQPEKTIAMANKLNKEYPSITETKNILKMNPNVSVDQVKGYDRRARNNEFIMEHVKIIERLTNENKKLKEANDDAVEKCCTDAVEEVVKGMKSVIEEVKEENQKLKEENEKIPHLKVIASHTFHEMDHFKQKTIELMAENETLKAELDDVKAEAPVYEDDEVDYYVDAGRKVVLKDGRIVKSKD